jgi:hypothetical protein
MPDWLDDLLLESVAPPPIWLPSRAERIADAGVILQRRFGQRSEVSTRPSHRLHDTILIGAGPRIVSGDEIESEMEVELTTINPPIAQGWIVATGAIVSVWVLLHVRPVLAAPPPDVVPAIGAAVAPLVAWLLALAVAGSRQITIELDTDGVRVRSWLNRWRRRSGSLLGPPDGLRARLTSRLHLELDDAAGSTIEISLALWPHTARQDLVDELPIWGADCSFDHHHHRHDRGHRRGRERTTVTRL